jgi:hypothetical protein
VIGFLRQLLRQIPGQVLVIWDGSPIHTGQPIKDYLAAGAAKRLHLERLPGYAPDLNPAEGIGNYHCPPIVRAGQWVAHCLNAGSRLAMPVVDALAPGGTVTTRAPMQNCFTIADQPVALDDDHIPATKLGLRRHTLQPRFRTFSCVLSAISSVLSKPRLFLV